jgi:dihydropteroate synthase
MHQPLWHTSRFQIDLSQPRIMGIVNVTPDSFSDGGQHASSQQAIAHCEQLVKDGAHILDIGGESSRPGAQPLPLDEELSRVLPVLQAALQLGVPVSVDTYKPQVMQAALDMGVDIVNDIWALRQPGAYEVIARYPQCGLVLMHMHRNPQTMQTAPMDCADVVQQVATDLLSFCELLKQYLLGLQADLSGKSPISAKPLALRTVIDPGIGFGKTVAQNFELLARQSQLCSLGYPLLAGWSRKSSLGAVTGLDAADRMVPSVVAALLAVQRGSSVVRVHDVRETAQALAVCQAANPVPADPFKL